MAKRLDLKNVNIYYGAFQAVSDVTLSILPRSVTAFIGASGCGKTTVLRILNRMHEVVPGARVEGTVLLDDEDIYAPGIDPVGVRRAVGMVFQRPNPFPAMSIRDNVVAGLKLQGVRNRKLLDDTAEDSLRGANLWDEVKDRLDKPGGGLSGGTGATLDKVGSGTLTLDGLVSGVNLVAGGGDHHRVLHRRGVPHRGPDCRLVQRICGR